VGKLNDIVSICSPYRVLSVLFNLIYLVNLVSFILLNTNAVNFPASYPLAEQKGKLITNVNLKTMKSSADKAAMETMPQHCMNQ